MRNAVLRLAAALGSALLAAAPAFAAPVEQSPEEKEIIARFQHALDAYNHGRHAQGCVEMGRLFDDTGDIAALRAHADPLMKYVPLGPGMIGFAVGQGEKQHKWAETCFIAYEGAYILRQKAKPDEAEAMLVRARAAFGQWAQASAAQAAPASPPPREPAPAPATVAAAPRQPAPDADAIVADAASGRDSRVALVIANSAYTAKSGVPSLKTPAPDAALMADALKKAGFSDVVVARDLGRREMADALRRFQAKADAADTALIYYAGHGLQAQGENYAVPVDAQLSDEQSVADEAVSQARLMDAMASTHKLKILIMDACRNSPLKVTLTTEGKAGAAAAAPGGEATRSLSRGLVRIIPPKSHSVVVYSAGPGQTAQDGSGADSPFAAALAKRMLQPGVEIDLMLRQVASDVSDETHDAQRPNIAGNLGADPFFFVPPKG